MKRHRSDLTSPVREGTAALVTDDESDGPILCSSVRLLRLTHTVVTDKPTEESKAEAAARGEPVLMSQCMFELDMATWEARTVGRWHD